MHHQQEEFPRVDEGHKDPLLPLQRKIPNFPHTRKRIWASNSGLNWEHEG